MANLKFGNTNIGKISIIEPPEVPVIEDVYPTGEWVRPAHWLDMPTIGSGEHKAAFLWAIPSGDNMLSNYFRLGCKGPDDPNNGNTNYRLTDFTIDWGDGTTGHFNQHYGNSPVYESHRYDYSQLDPATEFEFRGLRYRQAVATLDAGSSGISQLEWLVQSGANRQSPSITIMEFDINAPSGEQVGVHQDTYYYDKPMLEKARLYAPKVKYLNSFFAYTHRLKVVDITTGPDLIRTNQMFLNSKIDYLPDFETSGVQSCYSMFQGVRNIKVFPSGKYNFSNVYRNLYDYGRIGGFSSMFYSTDFEEIHIDIPQGGPDRGNQSIEYMFRDCFKLKKITGNWDTSKVQSMYYSFAECNNLVSTPEIDFSSMHDGRYCFYRCGKIQNLPRTINLPYAVHTDNMFGGSNLNGSIYIEDIGSSGNQGGYLHSTFNGCKIKKVEFSEKPLYTSFSYGIQSMFSNCQELEYVGYINAPNIYNFNSMFRECRKLKKVAGINSPKGSNFGAIFFNCRNLESIGEMDITCQGTGNVYFGQAFYSCNRLKELPNLDFSRVFYGADCFAGVGYGFEFELDCDFSNHLSSFNPNYSYARYNMGWLRKIKSLVIPTGAYLDSTFSNNYRLKTVPFVEASGAYTLAGLFHECRNLEVGTLSGVTCNIGYYRTSLSSGAIEDIFNWLGTASATIDIRYTPGAPLLSSNTLAIATNKGWTVLT